MSFLPSSAASSVSVPSISGSSSLLPLLLQSSTLALKLKQTPDGASFLAKLLAGSLDPAHPSHIASPPGSPKPSKEPLAGQGSGSGSQRADKLPFADFVRLVRNAPRAIRALPLTAVESYQHGGENAGLIPHRYSLLTVLHPTGGPPTYIKLHMRAIQGSLASVLTAELADNRAALVRPSDRRLAALSTPCAPAGVELAEGPSLDALAALLAVVDKRTGRYDVGGRNCLWLADLVLFGCALKFRAHWLDQQAQLWPDAPLRAFLRGEADALAASTQCFLPAGLPGWLGGAYAALGRVVGAFDMQHEVEDVVGEWRDFVGAAVPPAGGLGVGEA